jgi:hypothetical protein
MRPERIVVACVIDSMEVGGAQRQLLSLFRAVDRARFDLRLVCLREGGAFAEQLAAERFPVVVVGCRANAAIPREPASGAAAHAADAAAAGGGAEAAAR